MSLTAFQTPTTYNDIDDDELIDVGLGQRSTGTASVDYADCLYILDKQLSLTRYEPNRIQRHYAEHRTGRDLILKARQVGISTSIQADMFIDAVSQTSLQATLAHDADTTAKLRRMAKRFYDNLPDAIRPPRSLDNATTTVYGHTGSEVTIATAGSLNIGRGGTYNRVHGSEVAFWKDADSIMSGLLQGVPIGGSIELESTANGAQGWFYDHCMEALSGDGDWTLHFYPWWWQDEYELPLETGEVLTYTSDEQVLVDRHSLTPERIKWRRAKQKELPFTFVQEYPEDPYQAFITSMGSVFGDISECLSASLNPVYDPTHRYVAGADWGQDNDYTSLSIIDATEDIEVFIDHWNHLDWEDMQWYIVNACLAWHVETIQPERNSIGSVNIRYLADKFESKGYSITLRPVTTDNRKKTRWVANFYQGIHHEGLRLMDKAFATSELRTYTQRQTDTGLYKYEASANAHDDTVIARLLAWDAACKVIG